MQPHHHVTVWAACALLIILIAVSTSNATSSIAQDSSNSDEFFNGNRGKVVDFYSIQTCRDNRDKINEIVKKEKDFYVKRGLLVNEADAIGGKFEKTETEEARLKVLRAEIAQIDVDLKANDDAFKALPSQTGPSPDCKKDFVNAMSGNMNQSATEVSDYLAKLDKISKVTATIKAVLPELEQLASSNGDIIAKIKADIETIEKEVNFLTASLKGIETEMKNFNDLVKKDPITAYDVMNKFGQDSDRFIKAEGAAKKLSDAFIRLRGLIETLDNTGSAN